MPTYEESAPAKVNLMLRVGEKRADGYHEIESLIAFADKGDKVFFTPGTDNAYSLEVEGPTAEGAGPDKDNLVLKAARALAKKVPGLKRGHFRLVKNLPSGAGLGGGSSDAAAALRLLARANKIKADDPRLLAAAKETGADVAVCLDPKARLIGGIGDVLSKPLKLPVMYATLVWPGVPVPTPLVYGAHDGFRDPPSELGIDAASIPSKKKDFANFLHLYANDLAKAARSITPLIASAEQLIDEVGDATLIRMTGSGSAVFALYETKSEAREAAESIKEERAAWWVAVATLR
ncbi:MAG: 4-(cytidine 5'-diphospho)-2-C-methyl-D-erythritol kinase [Xanthobacteraceae bacterium]|nr:4-(cytidine 5'-diphospho)-2-C-methyl-D-erythritol kinase [Xanthobacteraceae bacterium]QYK45575.1 MAG: 4-(cytidine 5'-diphospho)-2-C-methyl-D-erythritol kinase [Xanthobacteraceae bacterium]HMN51660.1 4-(cytidine 5'-diphospho)-2-C-methyl-D-erythritol kinase [Xanthobacteraceae bacterium]